MNALYQRLKELDPKAFERFCCHLLKERHPGADIKHVDGAGGDEGLDVFTGDLDGNPVVAMQELPQRDSRITKGANPLIPPTGPQAP